jgi:hypothetical protein
VLVLIQSASVGLQPERLDRVEHAIVQEELSHYEIARFCLSSASERAPPQPAASSIFF